MKYGEVVNWEWDGNEAILYDKNRNAIDILYGDELVQAWLDEFKDKEVFGGDPSE